ncbi:MAG: hypothetical protein WCB49_10610 [Gammaproteobacteria bacterium]
MAVIRDGGVLKHSKARATAAWALVAVPGLYYGTTLDHRRQPQRARGFPSLSRP